MCNRTYGSDPAHPQFWHNCLPNEEQVEKQKNQTFFKKKWGMNKIKAPKANNSVDKIASDKNKKITCNSPENMWDESIIGLVNN